MPEHACTRCPQTFCDACGKVYAPPHTTTCVKCLVDIELFVDDVTAMVGAR